MELNTTVPKPETNFNYRDLDQKGHTIVEYVWIGGTGLDIRSKAKTVIGEVNSVKDLGEWNYDGSSTMQATTSASEILMIPVALFSDPFRGGNNKIALCETFTTDYKPTSTNFRYFARKVFEADKENKHDPWFGIEQEYCLMQPVGTGLRWPYGWPIGSFPKPQGPYYCSVGSQHNYGREIMDAHYKACLNAGVKIFGTNAEVMPGQWEFQVGTCNGLEIGDHLWMARYLLLRTVELFGIDVSIDPKPIVGDWNGSGCHTNYSTNGTRNNGGMEVIKEHMKKLSDSHCRMIRLYGEHNESRLTGKHETSSIEKFSFGVANRGTSVRIPRTTENGGKGYYEDRRPAANIDPYVVSAALFSATCMDGFGLQDLEEHYNAFLNVKRKMSVSDEH
jgi:glutamine synthetase